MRLWWIFFFCFIGIFALTQSNLVIAVSKETLTMFFEVLVPSMFFLMAILKIMEQSGILSTISTGLFGWLSPVIHSNDTELPYVFAGVFLGFAANALIIKDAYGRGTITKASAQRILYTIHTPTISFCVLTCGVLLGNLLYGLMVYAIQMLVSFLFYRIFNTQATILPQIKNKPVLACIKNAIVSTGIGLYQMAGYILFTSVMLALFLSYTPTALHLPIQAMAEFASSAVRVCQLALPLSSKLLMLSIIFGFGGFCGHLQVLTFADEVPMHYPTYVSLRIFQAILSCGIMWLVIYILM